jgi:hypothetical protein
MDFDFQNEIDDANWDMLEPHAKRGALFLVDADLKLDIVAKAVAEDKVEMVKLWLDSEKLKQADEKQQDDWSKDSTKMIFQFVIVQPYVLVQLKPLHS